MKQRKENGKIFLNFNYNMNFANQLKRYCKATWNAPTKEWGFDEEYENKANDLMLNEYGFSMRSDEKITVQFSAKDFYHEENKKNGIIRLNNVKIAWRDSRDSIVNMRAGVVIASGEFKKTGGSSKSPSVALTDDDNVVLNATLYKEFYDTLSEEDKNKMTIIYKRTRREELLDKKARLLKELEEIEKELQKEA